MAKSGRTSAGKGYRIDRRRCLWTPEVDDGVAPSCVRVESILDGDSKQETVDGLIRRRKSGSELWWRCGEDTDGKRTMTTVLMADQPVSAAGQSLGAEELEKESSTLRTSTQRPLRACKRCVSWSVCLKRQDTRRC